MLESKIIKWILCILAIGVVGYSVYLLMDDQGHLPLPVDSQPEYSTAQIDSTIQVYQLNPVSPNIFEDSIHVPNFSPLKTKVDSDSLVRYDLHRELQEVVTIDLEEHKEAVFFTWDDVKAYFYGAVEYIKNYINKQSNENK